MKIEIEKYGNSWACKIDGKPLHAGKHTSVLDALKDVMRDAKSEPPPLPKNKLPETPEVVKV